MSTLLTSSWWIRFNSGRVRVCSISLSVVVDHPISSIDGLFPINTCRTGIRPWYERPRWFYYIRIKRRESRGKNVNLKLWYTLKPVKFKNEYTSCPDYMRSRGERFEKLIVWSSLWWVSVWSRIYRHSLYVQVNTKRSPGVLSRMFPTFTWAVRTPSRRTPRHVGWSGLREAELGKLFIMKRWSEGLRMWWVSVRTRGDRRPI